MSAYIHGSLALEERKSKPAPPARQQQPAPKPKPRPTSVPGSEKLLWLALAAFLFTVLGFYQYRESAKYEMNTSIVKLESEIRALESQNAQLKNDIAKLGSPERLIEKGIQLGLVQQGVTPAAPNGGTATASAE